MTAQVEGRIAAAGYDSELMSGEEDSFWEVIVTFPNGQRLMIDWNRAQHIEFSRSIELMLSLENGPHYFAAAL